MRRASVSVEGILGEEVLALRSHLHEVCSEVLCEGPPDARRNIIRNDVPHVELIDPRETAAWPADLPAADEAVRADMLALAHRCRPSHLAWFEGGGTGANSTSVFALAFKGLPHACRGLHISIAAARNHTLTATGRDDVTRAALRYQAEVSTGSRTTMQPEPPSV